MVEVQAVLLFEFCDKRIDETMRRVNDLKNKGSQELIMLIFVNGFGHFKSTVLINPAIIKNFADT
jgi:hypothetical protein